MVAAADPTRSRAPRSTLASTANRSPPRGPLIAPTSMTRASAPLPRVRRSAIGPSPSSMGRAVPPLPSSRATIRADGPYSAHDHAAHAASRCPHPVGDVPYTRLGPQRLEDDGQFGPLGLGVGRHPREVGADVRREVGLVDDEQVGRGDPRPALARNVVTARDVDHEDLRVDEPLGEGRGEVVPAGLDQDQIQRPDLVLQVLDRFEVGGDVVPDRGVRTGPRLHGGDPLGRQHGFAQQEFGVLAGVDVVGDDGEGQFVPQGPAERGDGGGLARTRRARRARSAARDASRRGGGRRRSRRRGRGGCGSGRGAWIRLLYVCLRRPFSRVRAPSARPAFADAAVQADGGPGAEPPITRRTTGRPRRHAPPRRSPATAPKPQAARRPPRRRRPAPPPPPDPRRGPVSGANRASTRVASNGSRLSNRTVADAGPLTLSYAAQ